MIFLLKNISLCRCRHTAATRRTGNMQIPCLMRRKKKFFLLLYIAEKKENNKIIFFHYDGLSKACGEIPQLLVIFSPAIRCYFVLFYF
jgi:hypothetical protein